jgi:ABC-2 type transport system permease protein
MFSVQFKNFIRSKTVIAAITLLLVMGIISIVIGKQFIAKQTAATASVIAFQKEHIERNAAHITDEFGLLMYYLKFAYINKPQPIAALAIGQQDVNTTIQQVTIRGIEAQRFDTDLFNPNNLLIGNFDTSFLVLFLLPLIIIAFTYNVLSAEVETGTWALIKIHSKNPLLFIATKMLHRFAIVCAVFMSIQLLATSILKISINQQWWAFMATAIMYISSWFAICFVVICCKKSSNTNALSLLGIWLLLCLIIPAFANNYITKKYPVNEAYTTLIKQRDGLHTKWDVSKDSTLQTFFKHRPQYKNYVWNKRGFNYLWYYAMQEMGDIEAANDSKQMQQKLHQRLATSNTIAQFFPSMLTQLNFSNIAQTGMQQHLEFLDSTVSFHNKTKAYFLPKIFGDAKVQDENWQQHTPQYFTATKAWSWGNILLIPMLYIFLFIGLGVIIYKRNV